MRDSPARIRAATLDDLEAVAEIERAVFASAPYPAFFFRQAHDLWGDLLRLAELASGEIAGYVLGAPSSRPAEAWVLSAAVRAEHRGRGIARRLTEQLLEVLAGSGARQVRLTVHPGNRGAIALYLGLGFRAVAEEPGYFGTGEPRLLMCRELGRG